MAAGLLVALTSSALFLLRPGPAESGREQVALGEVNERLYRSETAAQLVAVADMLARQPGGEADAKREYLYVASHFPDIQGGALARQRLENLKRSTAQ